MSSYHQYAAVEAAIESCRSHGADEDRVRELRGLIEFPLMERMTSLAIDREAVRAALDDTFARFSTAVCTSRDVNWLVWLTAHSLASLAGATGQTAWLDETARGDWADPLERRAFVLGAILALDGICQYRLMRCVRGEALASRRAGDCLARLQERLS